MWAERRDKAFSAMLLPSSSLRCAISVSLGRRDERRAWIWDFSDRFDAAAVFKSDDILRLICAARALRQGIGRDGGAALATRWLSMDVRPQREGSVPPRP